MKLVGLVSLHHCSVLVMHSTVAESLFKEKLTKRPPRDQRSDQETNKRPRDQYSGVRKTSQDISTPLGGEIQLLCQKQVTKSGTCVPESHKCNIRPILGAEITDGIIRDVPLPIHTRTMNTYQRNEWWQRGTFVEQKKFLWPDFWLKDIHKKSELDFGRT